MSDLLAAKIEAKFKDITEKKFEAYVKAFDELDEETPLIEMKRLLRDLLRRMETTTDGTKGTFTETEMLVAQQIIYSSGSSPEFQAACGGVVNAMLTISKFYTTIDAECNAAAADPTS
jgi:hypothetical protein